MPINDLILLKTLVLAYGLTEVLQGLSSICSSISLEITDSGIDTHSANEWMHRAVIMDGVCVELEGELLVS